MREPGCRHRTGLGRRQSARQSNVRWEYPCHAGHDAGYSRDHEDRGGSTRIYQAVQESVFHFGTMAEDPTAAAFEGFHQVGFRTREGRLTHPIIICICTRRCLLFLRRNFDRILVNLGCIRSTSDEPITFCFLCFPEVSALG